MAGRNSNRNHGKDKPRLRDVSGGAGREYIRVNPRKHVVKKKKQHKLVPTGPKTMASKPVTRKTSRGTKNVYSSSGSSRVKSKPR